MRYRGQRNWMYYAVNDLENRLNEDPFALAFFLFLTKISFQNHPINIYIYIFIYIYIYIYLSHSSTSIKPFLANSQKDASTRERNAIRGTRIYTTTPLPLLLEREAVLLFVSRHTPPPPRSTKCQKNEVRSSLYFLSLSLSPSSPRISSTLNFFSFSFLFHLVYSRVLMRSRALSFEANGCSCSRSHTVANSRTVNQPRVLILVGRSRYNGVQAYIDTDIITT